MEQPGSPEPDVRSASPLRGLAEAGLLYFEARSRLFQIEAQEAGTKAGRAVVLGLGALAFIAGAWLLLMPVAVWGLSQWLQVPWPYVAAGLGGAHLLAGGILGLLLRRACARLKPFEETINQFQRDREWIAEHKNSGN